MKTPINFFEANLIEGSISPSIMHYFNNTAFRYWVRSLYTRLVSVIDFDLPEDWQGEVKDIFQFWLYSRGFVGIFNTSKLGTVFQKCTLTGQNFYYQPTHAIFSNPQYDETLELGKDCELIKLSPDYRGVFDIIYYYAAKLADLDNAINMSIVNNKLGYILGAKNKAVAETLKKVLDKINAGEPAVIVDTTIQDVGKDKINPFQVFERSNLKSNYITTDQLMDFQTILNNFDTEIGIPTIPYQKKERMVTSEAESRQVDATSKVLTWVDCLTSSIEKVNKMFDLNISCKYAYEQEEAPEEDPVKEVPENE